MSILPMIGLELISFVTKSRHKPVHSIYDTQVLSSNYEREIKKIEKGWKKIFKDRLTRSETLALTEEKKIWY